MYLITTLAVISIISLLFKNEISELLAFIFIVLLVVSITVIPVARMVDASEIEKYNTMKETIEISREDPEISDIERANITSNIIEFNKELAVIKYWNNNGMGIFIKNERANLEPLK